MALSAQVEVRGAELLLWVIALDPDRGRVQWYNPEASGTGLSVSHDPHKPRARQPSRRGQSCYPEGMGT